MNAYPGASKANVPALNDILAPKFEGKETFIEFRPVHKGSYVPHTNTFFFDKDRAISNANIFNAHALFTDLR